MEVLGYLVQIVAGTGGLIAYAQDALLLAILFFFVCALFPTKSFERIE